MLAILRLVFYYPALLLIFAFALYMAVFLVSVTTSPVVFGSIPPLSLLFVLGFNAIFYLVPAMLIDFFARLLRFTYITRILCFILFLLSFQLYTSIISAREIGLTRYQGYTALFLDGKATGMGFILKALEAFFILGSYGIWSWRVKRSNKERVT